MTTQTTAKGRVGLRVGTSEFLREQALVESLRGLRTTDLADATLGGGAMSNIKLMTGSADSMVGFAVTVNAPHGGFDLVKLGLQLAQPGDVLVINAAPCGQAVWGGNLSRGAWNRGVAGVVVDGAVRDPDEIASLGLPVFADSTSVAAAPIQLPIGEVNVPIACGGAVVFPGDLVVGDSDGVMVIRPGDLTAILAAHAAIVEGHARIRGVLDAGEVTALEAIVERLANAGMNIPASIHPSCGL